MILDVVGFRGAVAEWMDEDTPAPRGAPGTAAPAEQLDLATVVETSQALSGELVLERLIEKLLVSAVELAGVDRALLIFVRGDELRVEAEATMAGELVTVTLRPADATAAELPQSMLRYVVRTHETAILDDASTPHVFSADRYIVQKRCRSVLCLPLLRQASLEGVLYLEHGLDPYVFTPARMEVLGLLASQAAISLENARLYADLKEARERTQETEQEIRRVVESVPALIRGLRDRVFPGNDALREEADKASMFEDIVGNSPPLREVLSRVCRVAPTDSTAFITGETGTGKELIARAIHRRSRRSSRPFVAVNCAVIPKDLIASELFGHEKGAFTGAAKRKMGRFELAEGGTLFLDEAGEIPLEIQVALLRVLQERRFERVGGTQSISSDVRVIAATNSDLEAAMNAGAFRRDLFYRLNVFPIRVPSLRERRDDIPLLVEYFIERFATQAGKRFSRTQKRSLDLLESYDWPGNIRELQNVIERSVIVCDTNEFSVDEPWLASPALAKEPKLRTLDEQLIREERKLIEAALLESGGKVSGSSGAAVKLGMPATTLYSKIQSLQIDRRRFKRS